MLAAKYTALILGGASRWNRRQQLAPMDSCSSASSRRAPWCQFPGPATAPMHLSRLIWAILASAAGCTVVRSLRALLLALRSVVASRAAAPGTGARKLAAHSASQAPAGLVAQRLVSTRLSLATTRRPLAGWPALVARSHRDHRNLIRHHLIRRRHLLRHHYHLLLRTGLVACRSASPPWTTAAGVQ